MQRLSEALHALGQMDKGERQGAEDYVTELLNNNAGQACVDLLTLGLSDELPKEVAFQGVTRVKRYFSDSCQNLDHMQAAVPALKELSLQRLPHVDQIRRRQLIEVIETLQTKTKWPELYPTLLGVLREPCSPTNQTQHEAALEVIYRLVSVYKEVNWKASTTGNFDEAASSILPLLNPLFNYKSLYVSHLCLNVFQCFVSTNTPAILMNDSTLFDSWMSFLLCFPEQFAALTTGTPSNSSEVKEYEMYVKCLADIGSITLTLMQECRAKKSGVKRMARYWAKHHAASFADFWLSWLRYVKNRNEDQEDRELHAETNRHAIHFLEEAVNNKKVYTSKIKAVAPELIVNLLFEPFLGITEEEQQLFMDDPEQFLTDSKFSGGKEFTCKGASLCCIRKLVNPVEDWHDSTLLVQLLQYLGGKLRDEDGPLTEGVFELCMSLKQHLMRNKEVWMTQMEELMGQAVIPRMGSKLPYLRAKACDMCGKFSRIPYTEENYMNVINFLFRCMQDDNVVVCISAATALNSFLGSRRSRPYIMPNLTNIINAIFYLLPRTHSELLVVGLRLLSTMYTPELAGLNLLQKVVQELSRHCLATQLQNQARAGDLENYGGGEDDDDEGFSERVMKDAFALDSYVISITQCTKALADIFAHLQAQPEFARQLQPDVVHCFLELLKDDDEDLILEVAEPLRAVMYASIGHGLAPEMWNLYDKVLGLVSNNMMMFEEFASVIENFLTLDPEAVLADPVKQQNLVGLVRSALSQHNVADQAAVAQTPQLVSATLQYMKKFDGQFDATAQLLFDICLNTLVDCEDPCIQLLLTATIMDFFYYNPNLFVGIMVQRNALAPFMKRFLHFFDISKDDKQVKYDHLERKVIVLGMVSMVECLFDNVVGKGSLEADMEMMIVESLKAAVWCVERNCQTYSAFLEKTEGKDPTMEFQDDEVSLDGSDDSLEADEDDDRVEQFDEDDYGQDVDISTGMPPTAGTSDDPDGFIETGKKKSLDGVDDYDDELDTPINDICEVTVLGAFLKNQLSTASPQVAGQFIGGASSLEQDLLRAQNLVQQMNARLAQFKEMVNADYFKRGNAIQQMKQNNGVENA